MSGTRRGLGEEQTGVAPASNPSYNLCAVRLRPSAVLFLPFLLSNAHADDANWTTVGGVGAFTPNTHVRMEREKVQIGLTDQTLRVHATFWFLNQGPATSVRMGFPDETKDDGRATQAPIRHFRSKVDGRPVQVFHEALSPGLDRNAGLQIYRSAWVKTVSFTRGGSRRVEVWYDAVRGDESEGTTDTYVFKTGATWRGTIGRIEAIVDWGGSKRMSRPSLRLTGPAPGARWTTLGPHAARLVLSDVKPRFDLDLGSVEGFWAFRLNGRWLRPTTAMDDSGPVIEGRPNDIRIAVDGLGTLFDERYRPGGTDVRDTIWHAPEARRFGGRLRLLGRRTLSTGNGRRLRLAHPATLIEGRAYVRLRDVFRALGGRYRYRPDEGIVDLTLARV